MARPLWCRHKECAGLEPYLAEPGVIPTRCPRCKRLGHWAAVPDAIPVEPKHAKQARHRYELNENDRAFLKSIRIVQE